MLKELKDIGALYRWFDKEGQLLYVGISRQIGRRVKEHSKTATWFSQAAYMTLEWADSREELEDLERQAIQTEGPLHNITHNDTPQLKPGWTVMNDREQELLLQLETAKLQIQVLTRLNDCYEFQAERAQFIWDCTKIDRLFVVCNHKGHRHV